MKSMNMNELMNEVKKNRNSAIVIERNGKPFPVIATNIGLVGEINPQNIMTVNLDGEIYDAQLYLDTFGESETRKLLNICDSDDVLEVI